MTHHEPVTARIPTGIRRRPPRYARWGWSPVRSGRATADCVVTPIRKRKLPLRDVGPPPWRSDRTSVVFESRLIFIVFTRYSVQNRYIGSSFFFFFFSSAAAAALTTNHWPPTPSPLASAFDSVAGVAVEGVAVVGELELAAVGALDRRDVLGQAGRRRRPRPAARCRRRRRCTPAGPGLGGEAVERAALRVDDRRCRPSPSWRWRRRWRRVPPLAALEPPPSRAEPQAASAAAAATRASSAGSLMSSRTPPPTEGFAADRRACRTAHAG